MAPDSMVLVTIPKANIPLVDGIFQTALALSATNMKTLLGNGDETVYVEIESQCKIYPRRKFSYTPLALRVPVDGKKIIYDDDGRLTLGLM